MDHFDALLFDCDGVIAETERDCHRVTFNQAFKEKGLPNEWDVELYGELLATGGGKERMTVYFDKVGWPEGVADKQEFVKELHKRKTALFQSAVESGAVPSRPGVTRLMDDAFAIGLKVAICSTSNEAAVTTIARVLLGPERLARLQIFAGDVVENKKPSPDVYLLAAKTLNVDPARCWVVEDSAIGNRAAKAAGMKCLVTKSVYTEGEDFEGADVVIKDLENGLDGPITTTYLNYKASPNAFKAVKPVDNAEMFAAKDNTVDMFSRIAKGDMGKGFPF
ncbi:HAD-like domain-containing protein [Ochromonadaceae sp. CCMP2298]|nr:HAD-like domain-containing protein [Ochromonadaceae sp. CCMP2298]